jgi:hypothetical protein
VEEAMPSAMPRAARAAAEEQTMDDQQGCAVRFLLCGKGRCVAAAELSIQEGGHSRSCTSKRLVDERPSAHESVVVFRFRSVHITHTQARSRVSPAAALPHWSPPL